MEHSTFSRSTQHEAKSRKSQKTQNCTDWEEKTALVTEVLEILMPHKKKKKLPSIAMFY